MKIKKTVKVFGGMILMLIPGMFIASALERGHSSRTLEASFA
jgi:hypothetical protein